MRIQPDDEAWLEFATREAVAVGMETELRGPILDGVEKGRGVPVKEPRRLPVAAILLTVSFTLGYLLGRRVEQ